MCGDSVATVGRTSDDGTGPRNPPTQNPVNFEPLCDHRIVLRNNIKWPVDMSGGNSVNMVDKKQPPDGDKAERYFIVDVPIRLTAAELARLSAVSSKVSPKSDEPHPFSALDSKVAAARSRALEILDVRKRRETVLGDDLFGEPAWDLMLDLFVQHVERQKTSSTSAAIAARVPPTTALRYLNSLVRKGLVMRHVSDHDLRVQYVALSDYGYREMLALLSEGY